MYNISICEDDLVFLKALKITVETYLKKLNSIFIVDCFMDGEALLSEVSQNNMRYDVIFFDIDLPAASGIEIARKIRQFDDCSLFIFITSMNDKVYQIFELDTFNFIRKEYFEDEIKEVLDLLIKKLNENNETYEFKTKDGAIRLKLHDILYFERNNRNIEIHTKDSVYITNNINLTDLIKQLKDKGFYEIYRGILINLNYVKYIENNTVILTTSDKLPISRRKFIEFKRIFFENL
ncbi:response regulator [Alkalibaculum sp. M08DMB]|uniref:Stage 0 sporulation protein A homolog n=1 Tax=Alkalibaculum sporogenes TaxID=2655001 RepID=A0A6A7K4G2_9FIRM|nr:LytTR family DNA-binding domain-containing protein [Alkalibaculum sporogenes]MPW24342.1 response regulator [Alkalibaculum sporogenes]